MADEIKKEELTDAEANKASGGAYIPGWTWQSRKCKNYPECKNTLPYNYEGEYCSDCQQKMNDEEENRHF